MTDQTRIHRLLQLLHRRPEVTMSELVSALGAPPWIITRDLRQIYRR